MGNIITMTALWQEHIIKLLLSSIGAMTVEYWDWLKVCHQYAKIGIVWINNNNSFN